MAASASSSARNQWLAWYVANDMKANEEVTLALFEALFTESGFRNYANKKVGASFSIPHDAVGNDHDSVGVLQQRVKLDGSSRGWGNVQQAMNPDHAMREFIKRAKSSKKAGEGPHRVAQSVQVSAYDGKTVLRGWSKPKPYGSNYQAKEAVAHYMIFRMRQACG